MRLFISLRCVAHVGAHAANSAQTRHTYLEAHAAFHLVPYCSWRESEVWRKVANVVKAKTDNILLVCRKDRVHIFVF